MIQFSRRNISAGIIIVISLIWFILGYLKTILPSEMRYINHIAAGFGMPVSCGFILYLLLILIVKCSRLTDKKCTILFILTNSLTIVFTILFEIWYQFYRDINLDSTLQFTFSIMGILLVPLYLNWYWRKEDK